MLPSATVVRHNALPIFIMAYCIDLTRSNFIAESSFNLNKLYPIAISKRYDSLTVVDYGEYFKLTIEFYFDCGHRW